MDHTVAGQAAPPSDASGGQGVTRRKAVSRRESLFFVAGLRLLRTLRSALRRALPSKREQVRPEGRASGRGSPPGRERVKWRAATLTLALIVASIGFGYFILPTAEAAIVFDAASSATGSGASLTWSHTVGGGSDRILVVGVSREPAVATQTFYSTAVDTTFTVPAGVTSIVVKVWGAGGGGGGADNGNGGAGGGGGYAYAVISVTPGEVLDIVIGGGGTGGVVSGSGNGGAGGGGGPPMAGGGAGAGATATMGGGGGGGGYAAVLRGATFLVIGAGGGGGGGGGNGGTETGGAGGAGGGDNGVAGSNAPNSGAEGGGGGTQIAGGSGGSACGGCTGGVGADGSVNTGGDGGNNGGGGGGSGQYGGGGGQGDDDGAGGGGGGSGLGDILIAGSGTTAGNSSDPDYAGNAGQGGAGGVATDGNGGAGNPGRIVLTYDVPYTTTGVTYNGVGLALLVGHSEAGDNARVELWYLLAPATGTNDIVISQSGANDVVGGATSWTGVDQTSAFGPTAVANGTTSPATVDVTSASNEVVVDVVGTRNAATLTVGAGQTQRWNLGVGVIDGGGSSEPGAATVTMSWTLSGTFEWAIAGVSLRPAGAATCDSLTVTTSDLAGQLWFNETVEPDAIPFTTQVNVSASYQTGATPALSVTNDGSTTCDVTIRLMSDPGTGRSLKFNTTNSAPWPADSSREVPVNPSSVTACSAVGIGGTCDIWLWADYENALSGQTLADVRVETV